MQFVVTKRLFGTVVLPVCWTRIEFNLPLPGRTAAITGRSTRKQPH